MEATVTMTPEVLKPVVPTVRETTWVVFCRVNPHTKGRAMYLSVVCSGFRNFRNTTLWGPVRSALLLNLLVKEETPTPISGRLVATRLALSDRQVETAEGAKSMISAWFWLLWPASNENDKPVIGVPSKLIRAE